MNKILYIISLFLINFSFAAEEIINENNEIKEILKNDVYEPNYFSMLLGLFFVIGLVYLTSYLYQKMSKIKLNKEDNEENSLKIESSINLGQNKSLHVVKINEEYILIGATQNNISYIKDIKQRGIDEKNC